MTKRICIREECTYWNNGCRECPDCKSPNTEVSTDCQNCLCCENIPDMLRWSDNSHWSKMRQANSEIKEVVEVTPEQPVKEIILKTEP